MANRKYKTVSQAKEARRKCNRIAQQKYREKLRMQRLAPHASPSGSTMRENVEEEVSNAVGPLEASVEEAVAEDVQDESREPDSISLTPTPLERVAGIDHAIEELLVSVEDASVRQSLKDPIAHVELKLKGLVDRVHQPRQTATEQGASIEPSIHYNPHQSARDFIKAHNMRADVISSLSAQVYRYRAQHIIQAEIKHLSAQVERAMGQVI
ncbi:hypothetical protein COCC4DRAFT_143522 [Bipolaris maydis ATCC 48331]|uniref:Uncharacterized protein n=2 Tax=Cochliobolus heterostrophus TaxID=5016 RepID=M2TJV8_COCH5|nr:uncharacterized protein COCC4DRAFT_143522 [Bipolaris maydis ATCC 48331]EMD86764.1 hypothetical protein COCHEDRAFT_1115384 [Bipolaris maydis C5]KAJ5052520.1 hypothetical protein J3E74DRAFT_412043 [Bipolaris maydis]ENI03157.1 hypothetical protein COCC4DRAFT_143522 [Bipolaris maydis ATCC 48331]KAJ6192203.1 hypothetical protein J3E72DRAFT_379988 [Bipolaris maydis]KAJ6203663.1 hypothetical protein PSV09DRAFT_1115384 [Bipolaris maydis]